jgi:hypothetical protein
VEDRSDNQNHESIHEWIQQKRQKKTIENTGMHPSFRVLVGIVSAIPYNLMLMKSAKNIKIN